MVIPKRAMKKTVEHSHVAGYTQVSILLKWEIIYG